MILEFIQTILLGAILITLSMINEKIKDK